MSVAPENAVTTDPRLVEVTRLSNRGDVLQGRKLYPDGLEAKGAEGEAARGDPAPMRSWLSGRCIEREVCICR